MNLAHGALDSVQAAGWTLHEKGTKTSKDKLKEVQICLSIMRLARYLPLNSYLHSPLHSCHSLWQVMRAAILSTFCWEPIRYTPLSLTKFKYSTTLKQNTWSMNWTGKKKNLNCRDPLSLFPITKVLNKANYLKANLKTWWLLNIESWKELATYHLRRD